MIKSIIVSIDIDSSQITIAGLKIDDLLIDYTTDIDFTSLVSALTDLADDKMKTDLNIEDYDVNNGKLKIVIDTIESIFNKFNESLDQEI